MANWSLLTPPGRTSFSLLQQRMPARRPTAGLLARVPVLCYAFDLLHLDGISLLRQPYTARRQQLEALHPAKGPMLVPPCSCPTRHPGGSGGC